MGIIFRVKARQPRNFSEAPNGLFLQPSVVCLSLANQLSAAWLWAAHGAVQEGPVTPDGSSFRASERV